MTQSEKKEMVNHPDHYLQGLMEPIEIIEQMDMNFSLGDAIKYICRADHKGEKVQDLKKAFWYFHRELKRINKMPDNSANIIRSFNLSPNLQYSLAHAFDYAYVRNRRELLKKAIQFLEFELFDLGVTKEELQELLKEKEKK